MNIRCKIIMSVLVLSVGNAVYATKLYVSNEGGNSVSIVDTVTNAVTGKINDSLATFVAPAQLAITPDGKTAYLANQGGGALNNGFVSIIDVATNTEIGTVTDLSTPSFSAPFGIAITPNGSFAYVTNDSNKSVSVIDIASNTVIKQITDPSFNRPAGIAITPDGSTAYVTNFGNDSVTIIDIASNNVKGTVSGGPFSGPIYIVITSDGKTAYVANEKGTTVSIINIATNAMEGVITGFNNPFGIAIAPDDTKAYVANENGNSVSIVDLRSNSVIGTVSNWGVSTNPTDVLFTCDGSTAYVTDFQGKVIVVNSITNSAQGLVTDQSPATFNQPVFIVLAPEPIGITGVQKRNKFLTQTDYINVISWTAPTCITPVSYKIYRDAALTDLAGTVAANEPLIFEDHKRNPKLIYTYYLVAVTQAGFGTRIANVTVAG